MPRETVPRQPLCADIDGFSLHATVRCEAHDRKRQEQLCRCITRPALSAERVQLNAAGQVELKLKAPRRDSTTHLVMSPLELMQRPAALVLRSAALLQPIPSGESGEGRLPVLAGRRWSVSMRRIPDFDG